MKKHDNSESNTDVEPEHEILDELSEEVEDEEGEKRRVADEDTVKQEGALNAEAVRSNRRRKKIQDLKRGHQKNVNWGENRAPLLYDDILALYPANTMQIFVERLGGARVSWFLTSQPRNGAELYNAILKECHGRSEEMEYQVVFRDVQKRFDRGRGRVTIPSTLDDAPALLAAQATYPNGNIPHIPPNPWERQPPPTQGWPTAQPPLPPASPMMPQAMPPAPAGSPPEYAAMWNAMSDTFSKMWGMMQQLQPPPQPQQAVQPQQARPQQATPPPVQGPGGMVFVPGYGWMMPAGQPQAAAPPAAAPPPPPPKSPQEQFRDSISLITVAVDAAKSMQSLIPTPVAAPEATPAAPAAAAEDGPMKTIRVGDMNVVVNAEDGSTRLVETALANGEKIMGWVDKQRRALQQQMQAPQMPQQQVPQQAPQQAPQQPMTMPTWPSR